MTEYVLHILKLNLIAAVIIFLTICLSHLTKRTSSLKWKYYMWLAVAVFLLVPLNFSAISPVCIRIENTGLILPKQREGDVAAPAGVDAATPAGQGRVSAGGVEPTEADAKGVEEAVDADAEGVESVDADAKGVEAVGADAGGVGAVDTDAETAEKPAGANTGMVELAEADAEAPMKSVGEDRLLSVFGGIWIAGIFLGAVLRLLCCYFSFKKLVRWSYPVEDGRIRELYEDLCAEMGIRRQPKLLISPDLSTPVLAGLFHTGLYLTEMIYSTAAQQSFYEDTGRKEHLADAEHSGRCPAGKEQISYDQEELRFILSHELTHYKRRDLWYKMLLLAVNTIYWFNPALYWMRSQAERDIENLCDGSVVAHCTREGRQSYSRLLLKTAAYQNHVPYLAASLNDSTLIFKERIRYMRNLQQMKSRMYIPVILTAAMMSVHLLVGTAVTEAGAGSQQQPDGSEAAGGQRLSASAQLTLYAVGTNAANYVRKAADECWYDGSDRQYERDGAGGWVCLTDGTKWTETAPDSPAEHAVRQKKITDAERYNQVTLYLQEDGSWQNVAGGIYADQGDGSWLGPDGKKWFDVERM